MIAPWRTGSGCQPVINGNNERSTMNLTLYHWIIIAAFIGVVIWAFGRKRKARFEKDAKIPFDGGKD
jgi:cytochrome c oxidase cbb3-type subunit 4